MIEKMKKLEANPTACLFLFSLLEQKKLQIGNARTMAKEALKVNSKNIYARISLPACQFTSQGTKQFVDMMAGGNLK